jgi:hypothetical protein
VIQFGNRTEYTLVDSKGHTETFCDTSPKTQTWTPGASLQYSQGIEYHLSKECPPSGPSRHVPPKVFPVDIVNYPPLQVKGTQGVEKYRLFEPCTAPYCRYGVATHSHCTGAHCPDTDSSFNCVDQLNRRILCATGLPTVSINLTLHTI